MLRTQRFLTVVVLASFWTGGRDHVSAQVQTPTALPPLVDQVSKLVRRHYFHPETVTRLSPGALADHAAMLPGEATNEQAQDAIDAMLAESDASHTGLYTADQLAYYELLDIFARRDWRTKLRKLFSGGRIAYTGIGVVPRIIDRRILLAGVHHGGPADSAGLLVGDEIVAADDEPFDPIASFADRADRTVTLPIRRSEGGPIMPVEVVPEQIRPNAFFLEAMRASMRVIDHDNDDLGYIRIGHMQGATIIGF